MHKTLPKDAVLIPSNAEKVFSGVIFDLFQWQQELYDGTNATFEMGKRADTVIVLAIDGDQIIVLSEQQPGKPLVDTLPGGRPDPTDDSWLDAAKREMHEETGMEFESWRLIEVTQPTPKLEWFCATFLAFDKIATSPPHLDAGEKITVRKVPLSELKELIMGEGRSGLGHLALLMQDINTVKDILNIPEYIGTDVSRD